MAGNVQEINEKDFKSVVLESELPVLVDFWAPWCGPCRMVGPVVAKVADALAGSLRVVKVNVDDNQQLAGEYHVQSIPTLMWFKGGQKVDQVVGLSDEATLTAKSKAAGA